MVQVRWASWTVGVAAALALCGGGRAVADVTSDRAAAILIWPDIEVGTELYDDTIVQLSNTSLESVILHCFYENANSHCNGGPKDGYVCESASDCCGTPTGGTGTVCGVCEPGWNETDFRIRLTPRQPLGWRASDGVAGFVGRRDDIEDPRSDELFTKFKIDGTQFGFQGAKNPDGSATSNAGSRIPPVAEIPFDGALKCIVVDENGRPTDRNVVKGEATLVGGEGSEMTETDGRDVNVARYSAVGILAIPGAVNEDKKLCLGGDVTDDCPNGAEYNGCPKQILLTHFFDFAADPVLNESVETRLIMVPCTEDLLRQKPGEATIQYLVWNEFEQRFSTSKSLVCKQNLYISQLDRATGAQRERSIFSAGVSGTLTGQTKAEAIGSGVLALADEWHGSRSADFTVHFMAGRQQPDVITLP